MLTRRKAKPLIAQDWKAARASRSKSLATVNADILLLGSVILSAKARISVAHSNRCWRSPEDQVALWSIIGAETAKREVQKALAARKRNCGC